MICFCPIYCILPKIKPDRKKANYNTSPPNRCSCDFFFCFRKRRKKNMESKTKLKPKPNPIFEPYWSSENRSVLARFNHYLPHDIQCLWLFQAWYVLYNSPEPIYNPLFSLAELSILREVMDFMIKRSCPCGQRHGCSACFIYPRSVRQLMVLSFLSFCFSLKIHLVVLWREKN